MSRITTIWGREMRRALYSLGSITLLVFAGCTLREPSVPGPHTQLTVEVRKTYIWTYQKVATYETNGNTTKVGEHLVGKIRSGDVYTLANGTKLTWDGQRLLVGEIVVPVNVTNLVIDANGAVKLNAFIRTFD